MNELDRLGWVVRTSYRIGEVTFAARSTSEPFGRWLDDVLAPYRSDDYTLTRYAIVVADEAGHGVAAKERYHTLYVGSTALIKTTSIRTLVQALFNDMETMRFGERDEAMFGDVLPVTKDGVTAIVPAVLVPYLMTLGRRRMARAGLTLPIEASSAMHVDTGEIGPVPPLFELSDDALDELDRIMPMDGHEDRAPFEATRRADVVISIGGGTEAIAPVSKGVALYRLGTHIANLFQFGERGLLGLKRAVEDARCYEMAVLKPAVMLDALASALSPA
jgi:hypothetical protein